MRHYVRHRSRYALLLGTLAALTAGFWTVTGQAQVGNPIPTPIVKQGLRVEIQDLVQMPSTQGTSGGKPDHSPGARARINFLHKSPDGRLFVNDLRGQLYTLDSNFAPQLFVDLDAANGGAGSIFPAMRFNNGLAAGFISFEFHPEFATLESPGFGKFYTIHMEDAATTSAVPDFATVDQRTGSQPVRYHTVVTEWTTPTPLDNSWNAASGTRRELLRVGTTADSYFHPYGDLQFNPLADPGDPDYGMLYISGGDWGYINGAGAPQGSGTEGQPGQLQRLDTLAGTLLRIDPRSPTETGGPAGFGDYTIPAINPFVDGNPNTFDEIYAFGFRNGHRMAWDNSDGQLYVMNVGHANLEEIERVVPGGNYGWGLREGTFVNGNDLANGGNGDADQVFANNVSDALDVDFRGQEFLYPVVEYDHGEGNAIAGGFVYQGTGVPQLQGKYVFGDIVNGRIFAADMSAIRNVDITDPLSSVTAVEEIQLYTVGAGGVETNVNLTGLVGSGRADLRFGTDPTGEIYIMTKTDGFIRRLGSAPVVPDRLTLTVDRSTGEVLVKNPTAATIDFDSYSILSASGSLAPADGAWNSLADQGVSGWVEAFPMATVLSELNPTGSLPVSASDSRSLGKAFAPNPFAFGVNVSDLVFQYSLPTGEIFQGVVEYVGDDIANNLVLFVDPATGQTTLKNTSPFEVSIDGYSVLSDAGALRPAQGEWSSLADQQVAGWQEANPTTNVLSEINPVTSLLLPSGAEYELGELFDGSEVRDLELQFFLDGADEAINGVVSYQPAPLAGDYNGNGTVDAADYVLWRFYFGNSAAAFAVGTRDPANSGPVGMADYTVWRSNFGNTRGGGAGAVSQSSVPEPPVGLIALLAMCNAGLTRCRTTRRRAYMSRNSSHRAS